MKIYVASSWRNERQPEVVEALRGAGHEVYDFRNPDRGSLRRGFQWAEIDPKWERWSPEQYREALSTPLALAGLEADTDAMDWADAIVMVQPAGRSAALELGWAIGAGKTTAVLLAPGEPELMLGMAGALCLTLDELVIQVGELEAGA